MNRALVFIIIITLVEVQQIFSSEINLPECPSFNIFTIDSHRYKGWLIYLFMSYLDRTVSSAEARDKSYCKKDPYHVFR